MDPRMHRVQTHGNLQGSVEFFCITTGRILKGRLFIALPMPDRVIKHVNAIGLQEKQGQALRVTNRSKEPYKLGCAFCFVFQFIPVLIFRNSGYSMAFLEFRGTHVEIKPFQGKINLLRNSGSGIPDPEFRREGPVTSATIPYRTTILLQFAHTIQCCLWCLVRHRRRLHRQLPYATHDIPSQ
jgi:hypothetical protein